MVKFIYDLEQRMDHTQKFYLNNDFRTCLFNLFEHGFEAHPRGTTTRELLNYNITLADPRNRVITFPERKTSTKYLLGEFIWYLTGSADPAGILPYAKFWDGIRNTDGPDGYPDGTINSNYGHRFFGHHAPSDVDRGYDTPVSQWNSVIDILRKDKDSRQAIMNVHLPQDRWQGNKDVACTLSLQFFIREDRLHLIVNMRSNDQILGFTNDVFQFTMLQECMMHDLRARYPQLELGFYYHNAGSMHIYSRHFEMAQAILQNESDEECIMPNMDAWNEEIRLSLISLKQKWEDAGMSEDFNFTELHEWDHLTPYWQALVLLCFGNYDEILQSWIKKPVKP